jgi:ribosome-binding protein aMBF1 (putative translation factor)
MEDSDMAGGSQGERGVLVIGGEEYVVLRRDLHERDTAAAGQVGAAADRVTIERGELERLRAVAEDFADLVADARFRARLAAGEEELVPEAVVERLLTGENPVRVWREHRGLTAAALAAAAGVSAAYLSEIERGVKPGSVAAMKRLADALRLTLDDLA